MSTMYLILICLISYILARALPSQIYNNLISYIIIGNNCTQQSLLYVYVNSQLIQVTTQHIYIYIYTPLRVVLNIIFYRDNYFQFDLVFIKTKKTKPISFGSVRFTHIFQFFILKSCPIQEVVHTKI